MREITLTERIVRELMVNDDFVEKSILLLYDSQTDDEQESRTTIYKNYMGFNRPDSFPLSRAAQRLKKGKHLSKRSLKDAKKRLLKYAVQLEELEALNFINKSED